MLSDFLSSIVTGDGPITPLLALVVTLGATWLLFRNDPTRRAEAELHRQRKLLHEAFTRLGEGVIVADAAGQTQLFNPKAEELLGAGARTMVSEHWAHATDNIPLCSDEHPLVRALRGKSVDNLNVRVGQCPDSERCLTMTARPIRDAAGAITGGVLSFHDSTEGHRDAQALSTLNEELELQIAERTSALCRANSELAQRGQDMDMLVHGVSHDLRSPLVNLHGFSAELETAIYDLRALLNSEAPQAIRKKAESLDGRIAESLKFIRSAVVRLGLITDALQQLSRAGRVEYAFQALDLDDMLQRTVEAQGEAIRRSRAAVTVCPLPRVWGDASAVEQLFANLVGNALKYLDPQRPGQIVIGCSETAGSVDTPPGFHTCFVRDNGRGIPQEGHAKVFQPFQRLHNAAPGEGMGLVIVRRIVERHGGRIWFESAPGIGTTFFVCLPGSHPDPSACIPET